MIDYLHTAYSDKSNRLTSELLQYVLHTAGVLPPVLLLAIRGRGRVQCRPGEVRAAAPAGVAAQAAAAAAAGGRGRRPPAGARRRPVGLHDLIPGLEPRVVPAPRLPRRGGRGARGPSETQVPVLDVLHLDPVAGRALRRLLGPDSRGAHGPVGGFVCVIRRGTCGGTGVRSNNKTQHTD